MTSESVIHETLQSLAEGAVLNEQVARELAEQARGNFGSVARQLVRRSRSLFFQHVFSKRIKHAVGISLEQLLGDYPELDSRLAVAGLDARNQMKMALQRYLNTNAKHQLNFAAAIPLTSKSGEAERELRESLRMIEELRAGTNFRNRVHGHIRILVTAEEAGGPLKAFLAEVEKTGLAKKVLIDNPQSAGIEIRQWIEDNPNASLYGLDEFGLYETVAEQLNLKDHFRIVRSQIPVLLSPIAWSLAAGLARVSSIANAQELRDQAPNAFKEALQLQGGQLMITSLALDILYQAREEIASAA